MRTAVVFFALVAIAAAAPAPSEPVPIIQYDDQRDMFNQFSLSYETGDGILVTRQGSLKPTADGKDHVLIQSGSTSYTAPDGTKIRETWSADENGYLAEGPHLPVTPASA